MKMFGKSFSALFSLHIIFILFAVKCSFQNDTNGRYGKRRQVYGDQEDKEPSADNANEQWENLDNGDEDVGEKEQSNEVVDVNDNKEALEQMKHVSNREPAIFKLPKPMHEPKLIAGFDLTPEEMNKFKIWKDGVIPYYIDKVSYSDQHYRTSMWYYLKTLNDVTGLTFLQLESPPTGDDERWVFFINRRGQLGCADHDVKNITTKGVQQVVLGYDCMFTKGEMAEAVMSILGIPAQHNAPDRDKYIKVNMENIIPEKRHMFEKLRDNEWLFHELEYDAESITHYDIHRYSVNGRATIEPKGTLKKLEPVKTFSKNDFTKIKMLYNYITLNKKIQAPECQKLFKPRNKYDRYTAAPKVQPRKKPNRYLGLPDDKGQIVDEPEVVDEGDDEEVENLKKYNEESDNEAQREQKEGNNESEGNEIQKLNLKLQDKRKKDALFLYSDYGSSTEHKKKG